RAESRDRCNWELPARMTPARRAPVALPRSPTIGTRASDATIERDGSRARRLRLHQCAVASNGDPALARFHELHELYYFGNLIHLRRDPLDRLREIELRSEQQPVCALQLENRLRGEPVPAQSYRIQSVQLHRVADRLDERRHVLRHT